ncbi:MAG: hypothetical protein H6Q84_2293 [Deltaproteobacteria bacterium]|nr:hypothetical protein [Deltaproteobacteria bacterium]
MKRFLGILALLSLLAVPAQGFAAERKKAGAPPAALRMEDLEVRGLKEKPEALYVPVLRGVSRPSPVRYDLFLVDMNRVVSPQEIVPQAPPTHDNSISRSVP